MIAQKQQARTMKENASKVNSEIEEGSIVQVPLADYISTKVDGKTLTLVVVQKTKKGNGPAYYRLACKLGPMKGLYPQAKVSLVPHGTMDMWGLREVFDSWRGKAEVSEPQAARCVSIGGGQGKKRCGCRGKCNTNLCSCYKWGRVCGSQCHGGENPTCTNHPPRRKV